MGPVSKGHGGKRAGAGWKRATTVQAKTVQLIPAQIAEIKSLVASLGAKNFSECLREVVELGLPILKKQLDKSS